MKRIRKVIFDNCNYLPSYTILVILNVIHIAGSLLNQTSIDGIFERKVLRIIFGPIKGTEE